MLRPIASLIALSMLLIIPPVMAQGHDHGAGTGDGILIMADLPADGRAVVGGISHFSYVILDEEGRPDPHNDVHVAVTLNGQELYATESAHDYDGVGGLDIVFPTTGTYNVTITVPSDPPRMAHYEGYVVAGRPAEASLVLDAPTNAEAGRLARFTYELVDSTGTLLPHTDALVEIRRLADDFPVLTVHTHTHDAPMSFDYAFEKGGTYLVTIVGYVAFPDEKAPMFDPVVLNHMITVEGAALPAERTSLPEPQISMMQREAAEPSRYRTETALDPASGTSLRVGPFSQVRASTLTYDEETMRLVQHLDYEATLTGPYGMVFGSNSLHEYDGVLEIMSANQMTGTYSWDVGVLGDADTRRIFSYQVAPANAPAFGAGPQFLDVSGLDRLVAGTSGSIDLYVHGAGDVPFQHSETGIRITDPRDVPLLTHKLHTHSTGTFSLRYTPASTGGHTLQVDPFDVHGSPTPTYHGRTLNDGRAIGFTITGGTGLPAIDPDPTNDETVHEDLPNPGMSLVLLSLVALTIVLVSRSRRTR